MAVRDRLRARSDRPPAGAGNPPGPRTRAPRPPRPRPRAKGDRMSDDRTLLRWTLSFLAPYRSRVVLLAVLLLAEVSLGAMQPLLLKVVIDYVLLPNPIPQPFAGWLLAIHEGNPVVLL